MSNLSRLNRHLSITASAIAASTAATTHAVVTYSGPVNLVVPANFDGTYLNVETGQWVNGPGAGVPGWDVNPYGTSLTAVSLYGAAGTGHMRNPAAGTSTARTRLDADTPIGSTSFFYGASSATIGTSVGQWSANAEGIFGFKFLASDGLTHYGWLRLAIGANAATRTIVDYAWESEAGIQILAGDIGGPPPAYDPCATFNPQASIGANNLPLNQDTAADLDVAGGCTFIAHHANYFKFTAPVSGDYVIDACASGVDTRIALLDGCAAGSAVLACNDDSCGLSSSMNATLTSGQVVYVVIGSADHAAMLPSPIGITVTAPPNPDCGSATALAFGSNSFDLAVAVNDQVVTAAATTSTFYKVGWFKFTPSVTGMYTLSTCGTINDPKLAIGLACPAVAQNFIAFAYNDDNCACTSGCGTAGTATYSSVLNEINTGVPLTQALDAGVTYTVLVGGYAAATLPVSGAIVIDGPPQAPPCDADFNLDGLRDGLDMTVILSNWGMPGGDVNGDGTTDGLDMTVLLSGWGVCP